MVEPGPGQVQFYTSAADFIRDADPIFADREAEHSIMLGVLGNLQKDMNFYNITPELVAVTGSAGSPVLLASMVHPHPFVLSLPARDASEEDIRSAVKCLANYAGSVLKEKKVFPAKIVGHPQLVEPLVLHLAARSTPLKRGLGIQFYSLQPDSLVEPRLKMSDDTSLTARRYEPEKDAGWLRKWVHEFFMDVWGYAQERMVENQLSELAKLPKEARGMFLLFQGENFVSYAGYGGATANTMRITGVFTPAEFRGRGYGQLICWYACRYLLTPVEKEGLGRSQLVIAADQNKTSVMGIYQRLGFRDLTEVREYVADATG